MFAIVPEPADMVYNYSQLYVGFATLIWNSAQQNHPDDALSNIPGLVK